MTFPVTLQIFGQVVSAHAICEVAGYFVGMQTYLLIRKREPAPAVSQEHTLLLIVFCVFGALFGSKILAWLESAPDYWAARHDLRMWMGGKTIVGGLLGGWIGIEFGKRSLGIQSRTGDAYVWPLVLGIAIGRVGCFLTGLPDHTYGTATSLPWGIDFGDYIRRHPTQLYEIAVLLLIGILIQTFRHRHWRSGDEFRLFMLGYLVFRFLVEFIKPRYTVLMNLSVIQLASAIGAAVAGWQLRRGSTSADIAEQRG